MGVSDGSGDRLRGRSSFGVNVRGAFHYNQWGLCGIFSAVSGGNADVVIVLFLVIIVII